MNYTCSMKYNLDFKRLYSRGKSIAAGYLVLYYQKNKLNRNVLGITVTKKFGKAVQRNRMRRLIRECYRLRESEMHLGYNLVLVARNRAIDANFGQIDRDLRYLLKKSGIIGE